MKRCRSRHFKSRALVWHGDHWATALFGADALICTDCGHWLPLGPSDETPVAVEIRAAEIAAGFATVNKRTLGGAAAFIKTLDGAEMAGWIERQYDSNKLPEQPGEHVGWLACAIAEHGEDQ